MPSGIYKRKPKVLFICQNCGKTEYAIESKAKKRKFCSLKCSNSGENNPMHGKHAKHKPDCQCSFCRAERGELSGEKNGMFGKGYLVSGEKNGNFKNKVPFSCIQCGKIKYVLPSYAKNAKYCSNECKYAAGCSEETKKKLKIARMHRITQRKDTSIEVKMQNILKENNIIFEKHKAIVGQPDVFIEPNICIFCDGDYWHTRPNSKTRDDYVNKTLKEQGYKILRFWEHEINSNIDICFQKIQQNI